MKKKKSELPICLQGRAVLIRLSPQTRPNLILCREAWHSGSGGLLEAGVVRGWQIFRCAPVVTGVPLPFIRWL